MKSSFDANGWLSAHIFFGGHVYTGACDRVITDIVDPFVRKYRQIGLIQSFFFIRYSEHGPHVRLRIHGRNDVLKRRVRPALLRYLQLERATETEKGAQSTPDGLTVQWIPYEPEVDRYGGPEAIRVAESFFCYSSEICIEMLRAIVTKDRSARFGKALLAMVVLLHVFCSDRSVAATLAGTYRSGYLRSLARDEEWHARWLDRFDGGYDRQAETLALYVNEVWARMDAGEPLSETLDRFRRQLAETCQQLRDLLARRAVVKGSVAFTEWRQCIQMIIPSYIHMTSNRLGVSIPEESYLAHLLQRALNMDAARASG